MAQINYFKIQQMVNRLFSSYNGSILGNVSILGNEFRFNFNFDYTADLVTLFLDMTPEDRCYLNCDGKAQLQTILQQNRCNMDLSTSFRDMVENPQVSISGSANEVLEAYRSICSILPMTICFDLHCNSSLNSIVLDPTSNTLRDIQKQYEVSICLIPSPQPNVFLGGADHVVSVYVRSPRNRAESLLQSINAFKEYIEGHDLGVFHPILQTKIDVPMNRHEIIGRNNSILEVIGKQTSTVISTQKSPHAATTNVNISGQSFSSIYQARGEISDRFVIELHFEMTNIESRSLNPLEMDQLGKDNGVNILMKPGINPNFKTIMVRGKEKDVHKLFDVRRNIIYLIKK